MNHQIINGISAGGPNTKQQKLIASKIAHLQTFEKEIPGIIVIHNLQNFNVEYMSENGLREMGTTLEELKRLGIDYYKTFLNKDSYDYLTKFMELIYNSKEDDSISFIQQARPTENDDWEWYASNSKIFLRDEEDLPLLSISYVIPITGKLFFESKIQRAFDENKFLKKNQHLFAALTKREKEILTLMAQSISSEEIAISINIAKSTVDTHRRNIRKKIGVESPYEITCFAQAFNLI